MGHGSRNRMGGSRFRCKPQIAASARHATCLSFLAAALVVTFNVEALRKMLIDALQKWVPVHLTAQAPLKRTLEQRIRHGVILPPCPVARGFPSA